MCDLNSNLSTLTDDKTVSLVAEIPSDGGIVQIDSAQHLPSAPDKY